MTREQRLELLKQIEKGIYVCSIESTFLDDAKSCAIHSAIEELEREPCTDAVSREDVKKFIESFIHEMITESGTDKNAHTNEVLREVARGVGDMPPVTPEKTTITYKDCAEAMLKMWIDNVLTGGQYNKIMDKLNTKHIEDMRGARNELRYNGFSRNIRRIRKTIWF